MAVPIKDAASVAKKYVARAGGAGAEYKSNTRGAGSRWQAQAAAAEEVWRDGVNDAMTRGAFAKGVAGKAARYEERIEKVGEQRYAQGVRESESAYAEGVQPHLQAMAGASPPQRFARRDPRNLERVRFFNDLNAAVKLRR